jgi:phage baseplate assembly protein W
MAFGAKKIYPIDQVARKAVGVSLPFNGNAVFKPTFTTKDAIRNNLINFLLTNPQERVFNSTYGGGLRKYVFQQISSGTFSEIQNYIEDIITKYFPNLAAQITVASSSDYNTIYITIDYIIINTGINDSVQLNLSNG